MQLVRDARSGITRLYDPQIVGECSEYVVEVDDRLLPSLELLAPRIGLRLSDWQSGEGAEDTALDNFEIDDPMAETRDLTPGPRKMVLARFSRMVVALPGPDGKLPRNPPTRRSWGGPSERDESGLPERTVGLIRQHELIDDAIWTMCMVMADRGCRLASIEEVVAFLEANHRVLDRTTVMCAGSCWGESQIVYHPFFHAGPFGERLFDDGAGGGWLFEGKLFHPDTAILFVEDPRRPIEVHWGVP